MVNQPYHDCEGYPNCAICHAAFERINDADHDGVSLRELGLVLIAFTLWIVMVTR